MDCRCRALVAIAFLQLGCGDDGNSGSGTQLTWVDKPASPARVGEPLTATWNVTTSGALHVAILRGCEGAVDNCGIDLFDAEGYSQDIMADPISATLTPDTVGTWTIVAFAHVDEDPHLSEPVQIKVE